MIIEHNRNELIYVLRRGLLIVGFTKEEELAMRWAKSEEGNGWTKAFLVIEKQTKQTNE